MQDPGAQGFGDWKELVHFLLDQDGQQAVLAITTPTPMHAEIIDFALDAGIRFFLLDKPATSNPPEYVAVLKKAEELGALIIVSYQHGLAAPSDEMELRISKHVTTHGADMVENLSLIHISEPTRPY